MLSTVKDYWRFSQMILNGGEFEGKRYLKASTVEMMHTSVLEPGVRLRLYRHDINGLGFGLGYAIVQDPAAAKTSQGLQSYFWGGLFGTSFWIDPVNDMIVISFINNISGSTPAGAPLVRELSAQLVYRAVNESSRN
jgi:CubicO group peptidase (beta-lactamase class C family)